MKILVACEESQRVCTAFREKGHEAFSCDILETSGTYPEWHIVQDVTPLLNGNCEFRTQDGTPCRIVGNWDMIIAFPPCTYLSNVATRAYSLKSTPAEMVVERWELRAKAVIFFMRIAGAECKKIAIENPVGFMNSAYRKPEQVISPWMFCESETDEEYVAKRTCLWLKGLPKLKANPNIKPYEHGIYGKYSNGKNKTWEDYFERSIKGRSKTFKVIARAMAEQWTKEGV